MSQLSIDTFHVHLRLGDKIPVHAHDDIHIDDIHIGPNNFKLITVQQLEKEIKKTLLFINRLVFSIYQHMF